MNFQKDTLQAQIWRKISPTKYQHPPPQLVQIPSEPIQKQGFLKKHQNKFNYGQKQHEESRHRSPSHNDHGNQYSKLNSQLNQLKLQNSKLQQQNRNVAMNYNRLVDQNRQYRTQIEYFRTEFSKLRDHINNTQSIRHEIVKVTKQLQEQKGKTQKYINQNNKLVNQIKVMKGIIDSERILHNNLQKQKSQLIKLLELQRKQKQQKILIINQSKMLFQDEMRQIQRAKLMEQVNKNLDKQIQDCQLQIQSTKSIRSKNIISENEGEIIRKLEIQLDSLRSIRSRNEIQQSQTQDTKDNEPMLRNLKVIFDEQKNMLLKQLMEKQQKLSQLTNRLQSLTLGGDSQQEQL